MSSSALPPELEREVERLKRRVSDLERLLRDVLGPNELLEQPFTLSGPLRPSISPPFRARNKRRLVTAVLLLDVAGETESTVRIYKNDDVADTITVPAGARDLVVNPMLTNRPDYDRWQVGVTAAGTGAEGLDVQLRWQ
jgi:hypothetical protein